MICIFQFFKYFMPDALPNALLKLNCNYIVAKPKDPLTDSIIEISFI